MLRSGKGVLDTGRFKICADSARVIGVSAMPGRSDQGGHY